MKENAFTVRVSRWLLLLIAVVGLLFLCVGLDLAALHILFEPGVGQQSPVVFWIFSILAISLGSVIVVTQAQYLISAPVMMRISREEVSFGIGLRYSPTSIPLKHLRSVGIYEAESMFRVGGQSGIVKAGVELQFERTGEIPSSLATSAGIGYSDYCLRLSKTYMNRSLQETVDAVREFIPGRRRRG